MRTVSDAERRARLALRHRLHPSHRCDDICAVADGVVALHSSDPATVFLSVLARMAQPDRDAIEAVLYEQRTLVRHLAMRRTLWVATPERIRQAHATASVKVAAAEHRRTAKILSENGIEDPEAWLADAKRETVAALHAAGQMSAREMGRAVPRLAHRLVLAPGKSYSATQGAHSRVLLLLGLEGVLVRARPKSWISGEYRWAVMDDWLPGGVGGVEQRPAAAALAHVWLLAFGPATAEDLVWWTGWTKTIAAAALTDARAVPVELEDRTPAWLAAGDADEVADPGRWLALLPSLDPSTMGWKRRGWYLPDAAAAAFDGNGNGGPTIWVDGQVAGAWAQAAGGEIRLHWFTSVPARRRAEAERRAREAREWIGAGTVVKPRFPGAIQATILGR